MSAEAAWPETRDTINQIIQHVMSGGEAVCKEDQLIPICRNGNIEVVYRTFIYCPVEDESKQIVAVLVTRTETTHKIQAYKNLEASGDKFCTMAQGLNTLIAEADEIGNAIYFNQAWINITARL